MRRLYFVLPEVDTGKRLVNALLLARVEARHIHVLGKDHHAIAQADLPEGGLLQQSDFVPAVERGLAIGGTTGVLTGLGAVVIPSAGLALGGGAVLGIGLLGAGLGAWISGMIGVSVPNSRLEHFSDTIEHGGLLMMVDIPVDRIEEIESLIRKHHPEVELGGIEPATPPFP